MKRTIAFLLVLVLCLSLCACNRATVAEEIYFGQERFSPDEAEEYLRALVGGDAEKYEFIRYDSYSVESVKCTIIDDTDCKGERSNQVSLTGKGETKIQLPCDLSNILSQGWARDQKGTSLSQLSSTNFKDKNGGRIWLFGEDSNVLGLSVDVGDFSFTKKENCALIYDNQIEFNYMGITRKSTPADVIRILGLPTEMDYRYSFWLELKYSWFDEDGLCNSLCFGWRKSADGPEIMSDFKIRGGLTFFASLLV